MNVDIIASGSSGNCAVIDGLITIDVGVKPTFEVMESAVALISHEHSDHIKGLPSVQGLPIYTTVEVAERLRAKFPYVEFSILPNDVFTELPIHGAHWFVRPICLKHDVPCVGWDIKHGDERILFATDFNEIIDDVRLTDYNALYLECNNTLDYTDMIDAFIGDQTPRDEFHRRKSFQNHCNVGYLQSLIERDNAHDVPLTLLHKSSYYYAKHPEKIVELCNIAHVINPNY